MLIENQKVTIKWHPASRKWYESKGYVFTQYNKEFEVDASDLSKQTKKKVKIRCDFCGEIYESSFCSVSKAVFNNEKCACRYCAGKKAQSVNEEKRTYERFEKAQEICTRNDLILISNLDHFKNIGRDSIEFVCPKHGKQTMKLNSFLKSGKGCRQCSYDNWQATAREDVANVKHRIESFNGNKLLNPEEYINSSTPNLRIICGICGNEYTTSKQLFEQSHLHSCPDCGRKELGVRMRLNADDIETEINSYNGNILLNKENYEKNTKSNLRIKCGSCGREWVTSLETYRHSFKQCPKCRGTRSKGEYVVREFLKSNNINYIQEKRFDDCKALRPLPFDFYLPEKNMAIEFNGKQHYEPIEFFGGEEVFSYRQHNDRIKRDFCNNNKITLLEIPYSLNKTDIYNLLTNTVLN